MLQVPGKPTSLTRRPSYAELLSEEDRKNFDSWLLQGLKKGNENSEFADLVEYPRGKDVEFAHRGLKCRLFRNDYLAWCGIVICDKPPLSEITGSQLRQHIEQLEVHGGLSFPCQEASLSGHFAFDCCHTRMDAVPYIDYLRDLAKLVGGPTQSEIIVPPTKAGTTYKNYEYARKELIKLADQIANEQEKRLQEAMGKSK